MNRARTRLLSPTFFRSEKLRASRVGAQLSYAEVALAGAAFEQVPGFAEGFVGAAGAGGSDVDGAAGAPDRPIGDDVPGIDRDEVEGEELEGAARIRVVLGADDVHDIVVFAAAQPVGGLDLDAEEAFRRARWRRRRA